VGIALSIDGNGFDAQLLGASDQARGDFAPIGDEQAINGSVHGVLLFGK
jgi:hypothetical protein